MSIKNNNWSKKITALYKNFHHKITHTGFRKLFNNTLWLFSDKIFRQGLNFLLTAYIARYLGVEIFGIWNYVIAFVVLFSFFSTLGVYNQLLRDFVRFPARRNEFLGSAFFIKLLGGCTTLLLAYTTIVFIKPGEHELHQFVALISLGYVIQSFDVIDFFFQSQLQAKWISISRFTSFAIFGALKLLFVRLGLPLMYFIGAQVGELFMAAMILLYFYGRNFGSIFRWEIKWPSIKEMLSESVPIFLAEIAILMYMRVDQLMIGELIGNKTLGIYSAAVRLSEIWYLIPGVICSSVFPSIVSTYLSDPQTYQRKLQRLYDFLVWVALIVGALVSAFAPLIVQLIYGEQFSAASSILQINIWASVFVFLGFASNQQLVLENLARISFYRTVFGLVANVALNFLLIPAWGAVGAAFATLIAQAFSGLLSNYFFKQTRPLFWMNLATLDIRRLYLEYGRGK